MANKSQLKTVGEEEFANNDPFAELTRIMGFDPRIQPTPRPEDDFAIDLEKELMGDFGSGAADSAPEIPQAEEAEDARAEAAVEADPLAPSDPDADGAAIDGFEEELGAAADIWLTDEGSVPAAVAEAPDRVAADLALVDMDFAPMDGPAMTAAEPTMVSAGDEAEDAGAGAAGPAGTAEAEPAHDPSIHSNIFGTVRPAAVGEAYSADVFSADAGPADPVPVEETSEPVVVEDPVEVVEAAAPEAPADPFAVLASLGMQPTPASPPATSPAASVSGTRTEPVRASAAAFPYSLIRPAGPAYANSYTPARSASSPVEAAKPEAVQEPVAVPLEQPDIEEPAAADHDLAAAIAANEDDTPDIETIEVHEAPVALADDLDLRVPDYGRDAPRSPAYDDLDQEFEQAFLTLSHGSEAVRHAAAAPTAPRSSFDLDEDVDQLFRSGAASHAHDAGPVSAGAHAHAEMAAAHAELDALSFDHEDFLPDEYQSAAGRDDYGLPSDEAAALPPYAMPARHRRGGRGMMVAGLLAGVAVLGGIGVFALYQGGGVGSDKPVVVKADNAPVKVKPKNPGGMSVPNQDNKVYERVAEGAQEVAPEQKKLVTSEEAPVDVASRAGNSATALPGVFVDETIDEKPADARSAQSPAAASAPKVAVVRADDTDDAAPAIPVKSEDRVRPESVEAAPAVDSRPVAVAPHRVRTMIVRPDGTLVQREEEAPQAPAAAGTQVASASDTPVAALPAVAPVPSQPAEVKLASVQPAAPADEAFVSPAASAPEAATPVAPAVAAKPPVEQTVTGKPVEVRKPVERDKNGEIDTPARVAVAPSRPADQPLDIVGAARPDKPASARPDKAASAETPSTVSPSTSATAGGWTVQIASQPTPEAAQTSYQNLARRYGDLLGGHAVNIVKADIAGKGIYYRVRMLASSKEDAIALCTKYKAAGGSCFVSR